MAENIRIPGFIQGQKFDWSDNIYYTWMSCEDMTASGYFMVCPHELTFTLQEPVDVVQEQLKLLDKEEKRLQEELRGKLNRLEEARMRLLALPSPQDEQA